MSSLRFAVPAAFLLWASSAVAEPAKTIDAFDSVDGWTAHPADGVEMKLSSDAGDRGRSLRVDFRFLKGGGYAVLHKDVALDLPENYRFDLRVRGESPPEHLEFKLIDSTGANVWWYVRRDFSFPTEWTSLATKRRQVQFAWGPAGGGEIRHVAAIEFAITAGSGGSGTVWFDQLTLAPLPPPGATLPRPIATASSSAGTAGLVVDADTSTAWTSAASDGTPSIELDLGGDREFGGAVIDWVPGAHAVDYDLDAQSEAGQWSTLRRVRYSNGGRDYLLLPESEARRLRLRILQRAGPSVAVREIAIESLEWGSSPERFFEAIAADAPRGRYPRAYLGEQTFWTVVGVDGDRDEMLLDLDGRLEVGKGSFSLEPFLYTDGRLLTWADSRAEPSLEDGFLPIPTLLRTADSLELRVHGFALGSAGSSSGRVWYRLKNLSARQRSVVLYVAARPFQVNPPTQFLNAAGGAAPIHDLVLAGPQVLVGGKMRVFPLSPSDGFGASTFDSGDVTEFLASGRLPSLQSVADGSGFASGAWKFSFDLSPGEERKADFLIALHAVRRATIRGEEDAEEGEAVRGWGESLRTLDLRVPPSASEIARTLQAQIGYILVNRDSAAIQPGSRSYERSWIRDGSLTSTALLRTGHEDVVRQFIQWFAPYQYDNGKVPCCVDARGSDPVPEHDSSGQFIYLVAEYFRYTGDRALAERMWPRVLAAANYLDSLRQQRMTPEYRAAGKRVFWGILPPSISHEGYSAKPMHSYWDDLFALRGFRDAAFLAGTLGHESERPRLEKIRDEFARDLAASVRNATIVHRIDYIPGAADLGDFDATSTTIALDPVQAQDVLPRRALERTFERYWEFFRDRRDGRKTWDAFTPYEVRAIGAFVRLGWRDRALELIDFFLRYRRPPGWAQWPEVVRPDGAKAAFLGDLPHTWVGSDFVRSALDLFAYEDEPGQALVVAAGIPRPWLDESGVSIAGLRTRWGKLGYRMQARGQGIETSIEGGMHVPPGGLVLRAPGVTPAWRARIDSKPAEITESGDVIVRRLPARIELSP